MMEELGLVRGHILEERADCRQARIPAPRAVAAPLFYVVEEGAYEIRIDIHHPQRSRQSFDVIGGILNSRRKVSR